MGGFNVTRRDFLKTTGASALALSLHSLGFSDGKAEASNKVVREWDYGNWEDLFRDEWKWDKVTFGTHLVDCYPGNCSWRVYTKEGVVWREEQTADYPVVDPTGADWNPRGCQKGCTYGHMMYNPDRLKYPLKRVGERGEGKWKRISWDEASTIFADGLLDAVEKEGPESIIYEPGPGNGGTVPHAPRALADPNRERGRTYGRGDGRMGHGPNSQCQGQAAGERERADEIQGEERNRVRSRTRRRPDGFCLHRANDGRGPQSECQGRRPA